ncbi:aspartate kinase [Candidatus Woesebacteria bacterium]|nr:aspartate kinase [Candidatus Woesebacteria bacterium]
MKSLDVLKFGGTSVGNLDSIYSSIGAAESHIRRGNSCLVVVSAMSGITNLLTDSLSYTNENSNLLSQIETRHRNVVSVGLSAPENFIANEQLSIEINSLATTIEMSRHSSVLSPYISDYIISAGERLIAPIFASFLRDRGYDARYLDANHVFATDNQYGNASAHKYDSIRKMKRHLLPLLKTGGVVVMPGFYGDKFVTFGRGGSDYSATKAAQLLSSLLHVNGTFLYKADVDGVMSADPRIVGEDARIVTHLNYEAAEALAHSSARILHSRSIEPLKASNIPLYCRNTINFEAPGTEVCNSQNSTTSGIKIVTSTVGRLRPTDHSIVLVGNRVTKVDSDKISTFLRQRLKEHNITVSSDYDRVNSAGIEILVESFPQTISEVIKVVHSILDDINSEI